VSSNPQTGTTHTLAAGDFGYEVECTNASPITVTLPPGVFRPARPCSCRKEGKPGDAHGQGRSDAADAVDADAEIRAVGDRMALDGGEHV
jgi:hypothetical protein